MWKKYFAIFLVNRCCQSFYPFKDFSKENYAIFPELLSHRLRVFVELIEIFSPDNLILILIRFKKTLILTRSNLKYDLFSIA